MPLAVLNPGGSDPDQRFPDLAGAPDDRAHAPVNYHAYAACTGGGFFRKASSIPVEWRHVLLLLRYDLKPSLRATQSLSSARCASSNSTTRLQSMQTRWLCDGLSLKLGS